MKLPIYENLQVFARGDTEDKTDRFETVMLRKVDKQSGDFVRLRAHVKLACMLSLTREFLSESTQENQSSFINSQISDLFAEHIYGEVINRLVELKEDIKNVEDVQQLIVTVSKISDIIDLCSGKQVE
jgi:hypothetical protein